MSLPRSRMPFMGVSSMDRFIADFLPAAFEIGGLAPPAGPAVRLPVPDSVITPLTMT